MNLSVYKPVLGFCMYFSKLESLYKTALPNDNLANNNASLAPERENNLSCLYKSYNLLDPCIFAKVYKHFSIAPERKEKIVRVPVEVLSRLFHTKDIAETDLVGLETQEIS